MYVKIIWAFLAVACLLTLFGFISYYAIDFPFIDDYNALFDFIIKYLETDDLGLRLHYIIRQHNEHRVAFTRLMVLVDYYVFGAVNLRHLIFLSTLNLVAIGALFIYEVLKITRNLLALTPIIFIFFHFQHTGNLLWAESSLQNSSVISLACVSIWLFTKKSPLYSALGLLIAIVTTFSSGPGPLIWFAIIPLLLVSPGKIKIASVLVVGGFSLFFYFHSYHSSFIGATNWLKKIVEIPVVVLGLIGSLSDIHEKENHAFPVFFGAILVGTFVFFMFKNGWEEIKRRSSMQFLIGVFLFGLLSALAISLGRGSFIENRYKIISSVCLLATYVASLSYIVRYQKWGILNMFNGTAFLFWLLLFWRYYPEMATDRQRKIADYKSQSNSPDINPFSPFKFRLNMLRKLGIGSPPVLKDYEKRNDNAATREIKKINSIKEGNKFSVEHDDVNNTSGEAYLVMTSDSSKVFYPFLRERNTLFDFMTSGNIYTGKKNVAMYREWAPRGTYQVSIFFPKQNRTIVTSDTIQNNNSAPPWLTYRAFNDEFPP